ncbi:MAG: ADP-dependent NAD(P)H-hydrate dehydratase / NAD(P)H-hydrate epimerase [Solirubrobacteraceae bacterium]|nr:ADP-dependent NAD(P)H-hydrate dehydratase / NAD(P)H-hydrate epimerase [Solirubrobacteraceae bacterium]
MTGWLQELPDAEQQRAIDAWAIDERGIAGADLMERAGAGLADVVGRVAPSGFVGVVCGKGNNGGDGRVAARYLSAAGRDVIEIDALNEDAGPERLAKFDVLVDALLGTGFTGAPRAPLDGVIAAINASGATVVSADMPSGVNGSTGEIAGEAVRAHATATFHAGKPGLWIHPGKACAGEVHVIEIGIPAGPPVVPTVGLIEAPVLAGLPGRGADSSKFSSGTVVVVGGAPGTTGAPIMAAHAAMRTGAGYVIIASEPSNEAALAARPVEAMFAPTTTVDDLLGGRGDVFVLGPGLGRSDASAAFAREAYARAEVPVVLDADGLNAFEGHAVPPCAAPRVLTPHAGELARLLGVESSAIAAARLEHAREAARRFSAIVVLKGDDTIIAVDETCQARFIHVMISAGGAPALATAGTGDVLSGMIGALLARGAEPVHAAAAAVHAHMRAGQLAAEPFGPDCVIASDVISRLPEALKSAP